MRHGVLGAAEVAFLGEVSGGHVVVLNIPLCVRVGVVDCVVVEGWWFGVRSSCVAGVVRGSCIVDWYQR